MRATTAIPLALGPVACAAIYAMPTPDGLTGQGQGALAVLALCAIWWLTTPVPLPVTSLIGLALLPLLGVMGGTEALSLFGNQAVFFVIGVFLVAAVMMRTGLSARLTLHGLRRFAKSEEALCNSVLVLSFSLCTVVVSHAVAALMLPIVLEIIRALDLGPRSRTARRLLLGMAWGTVCGSNLTLLSSARASLSLELYSTFRTEFGLPPDPVGILAYSLGSAPVALVSLLACGVMLRLVFPPEGLDLEPAIARLDQKVRDLGSPSVREAATLLVVGAMLVSMVVWGQTYGLGTMALLFSGALFALQVLQWEDAERFVNWGVALLYGGAIAVGTALDRSGAAAWLVDSVLGDAALGPWATVAAIGVATAGLTEVVSNSAVIAIMLPVGLHLAEVAHVEPRSLVWLEPVCAGFAFVLPTSTPAMAMVFGSGYIRVRDTLPGVIIAAVSLAAFLGLAATWWPIIGLHVEAP